MWPDPEGLQEDEADTLSLLFLLFTTKSPGDYPWNKEKILMMKRRGRWIRDLGTQGMTWWWVTWDFFWPHSSCAEVRGVRHWHQKPGLFRPTTRKRVAYQHRNHLYDNCSLQSNTTEENFNKVWVEGLVPSSAGHREHASTHCRGVVREGRRWDFHHYQVSVEMKSQQPRNANNHKPLKKAPTKLFNQKIKGWPNKAGNF